MLPSAGKNRKACDVLPKSKACDVLHHRASWPRSSDTRFIAECRAHLDARGKTTKWHSAEQQPCHFSTGNTTCTSETDSSHHQKITWICMADLGVIHARMASEEMWANGQFCATGAGTPVSNRRDWAPQLGAGGQKVLPRSRQLLRFRRLRCRVTQMHLHFRRRPDRLRAKLIGPLILRRTRRNRCRRGEAWLCANYC